LFYDRITPMEFVSKNIKETAKIARDFMIKLKPREDSALIIGLYGELGSGKTTFMKFLAEYFGIKETIQSPTFVIEKIYDLTPGPSPRLGEGRRERTFDKLIHIDAYRIEKEEEMLNLGWNEIISNHQNLICIEWPEKISSIMPPHIKIFFEHGEKENERKIKIDNL
jgi:tRNA threonylcarbamoyladenosine biosynthesis protein TsaE